VALDSQISARLKRNVDGLVCAVVQQYDSREVLMVGWMDDEALRRTLAEGRVTFWSRSRCEYWRKGDTSGHAQYVKSVHLDCDGDALLETPIVVQVSDGFVTDIEGGEEAARLKKTIADAEAKSLAMEKEGKLPEGEGSVYRRNARNIGELGIGLNPAAVITGNMLEDEKAFRTCHFAIGENYDSDAPALIHLDGVVREPTIEITYEDGSVRTVLQNGDLML